MPKYSKLELMLIRGVVMIIAALIVSAITYAAVQIAQIPVHETKIQNIDKKLDEVLEHVKFMRKHWKRY